MCLLETGSEGILLLWIARRIRLIWLTRLTLRRVRWIMRIARCCAVCRWWCIRVVLLLRI